MAEDIHQLARQLDLPRIYVARRGLHPGASSESSPGLPGRRCGLGVATASGQALEPRRARCGRTRVPMSARARAEVYLRLLPGERSARCQAGVATSGHPGRPVDLWQQVVRVSCALVRFTETKRATGP